MPAFDLFKRISRAPTNPGTAQPVRQFDVADLYRGAIVRGVGIGFVGAEEGVEDRPDAAERRGHRCIRSPA